MHRPLKEIVGQLSEEGTALPTDRPGWYVPNPVLKELLDHPEIVRLKVLAALTSGRYKVRAASGYVRVCLFWRCTCDSFRCKRCMSPVARPQRIHAYATPSASLSGTP